MHNLLENAIKFNHPDDRVEVCTLEDVRILVIKVADTDPGIPENEPAYMWEEYFRGQVACGIPGSGLGLALVRAVIEPHG
jgi:signal transduction histidine kinase